MNNTIRKALEREYKFKNDGLTGMPDFDSGDGTLLRESSAGDGHGISETGASD